MVVLISKGTRRDSAYWRDIAFGVSEESAIQHWLQLQVIFCVGMQIKLSLWVSECVGECMQTTY